MHSKNPTNNLLLDTGASAHILSDPAYFTSFYESFIPAHSFLEMADGSKCTNLIENKGTAEISILDINGKKCKLILNNALLVPSFRRNIISFHHAVKDGFYFDLNKQGSEFMKNPEGNIFKIHTSGHLYFINNLQLINTVITRTLDEWHQVLGHMCYADILRLPSVVKNMKISKSTPVKTCEICILSKMSRKISTMPDDRGSKPFESVHVDLNGPIMEPNPNDYKYVFGVVCDYSQFLSTYMLKSKSDSPEALHLFLADTSPFGTILKLRSDNGMEFCSNLFNDILTKHKIRHDCSSPWSPHMLGHIERQWRTIFNTSRSLLYDSGLPKHLWPYAVKHATYLRNRTFQPRIGCTPLEKACGKQPDMAKIPIFGSKCYRYNRLKTKLEPRAILGVFIGFDERSPAKLVYNPHTGEISKAQDVKYIDELFFKKSSTDDYEFLNSDISDCENFDQYYGETNGRESADFPISPDLDNCLNSRPDVGRVGVAPSLTPASNTPPDELQTNKLRPRKKIDYNECQFIDSLLTDPSYIENLINDTDLHEHSESVNCLNDPYYQSCYHINVAAIKVPNTFNQAINSKQFVKWIAAMDEEIISLHENNTWVLVKRPPNAHVIGGRWVYQLKCDPFKDLRYKARYVAQGFTQKFGLNYLDTFAPTARTTSVKIVIQISVHYNFVTHHCDVTTAYLHSEVDFEMYLEQPKGYISDPSLVCKLNKSIYGLKQSAARWHSTLISFMSSQGLVQSVMDPCIFVRKTKFTTLLVLIWVDDLIVSGSDLNVVNSFKVKFGSTFKIKDLGVLHWFLGIQFKISKYVISMNQSQYIHNILVRFNELDSKPRSLPCDPGVYELLAGKSEFLENPTSYRELVGSLIYLMTGTRPDISFIVTLLSRFMHKPTKMHMNIARGVLKYLKGTQHYDLKYVKSNEPLTIYGYSDSDWASANDYQSVSGYAFKMSKQSALISWRSGKQSLVAGSSCEAEYIALHAATCEALFLRQLFAELTQSDPITINIFCDNQGCVALAKHPSYHKKTKHINIKYHAIRIYVQNKSISLSYVPTKNNIADLATKPLKGPNLKSFAIIRGIAPKYLVKDG